MAAGLTAGPSVDRLRRIAPWLLGWAILVLAGAFVIVRLDIAARRDAFDTDARIAHRLLSQRAVQNEAILATLALLRSREAAADRPEARLAALYPHVPVVLRRAADESWPDAALDAALRAAEQRSRATGHAVPGPIDAAGGRYMIVLAAGQASFALGIDVARMVPWEEWPVERAGPVRVTLSHAGETIVVQPGASAADRPTGITPGFVAAKTLAAASQPFELRLQRATGPAQWPWLRLAGWTLATAAALAVLAAWLRGRRERRRAEALLRIGQVGRLNALGELAGGVAHELNQPLAATLANAQAARRMLEDDPPEVDAARAAVTAAAAQARRAADVVARLRRQVESPDTARPRETVRLASAVRGVLDLMEPQLARRSVRVTVTGPDVAARVDPTALEQIVHNLVGNAMQALEAVPADERRLVVALATEDDRAVITFTDAGPGIPDDVLPRLFEPFFTTKAGGLGLGLSLCESLARAMDGTIDARNVAPRGAAFRLVLPLREGATPARAEDAA